LASTGTEVGAASATMHRSDWGVQLGQLHVYQYVAASALVALACMPDQRRLPSDENALSRGPFRGLMLRAGLLDALIALAQLDWPSNVLLTSMRHLVASGMVALCATVDLMSAQQRTAVRGHIRTRLETGSMAHKEIQPLSTALWMLSRQRCTTTERQEMGQLAVRVVHVCIADQLHFAASTANPRSIAHKQGPDITRQAILDACEMGVLVLWQSAAKVVGTGSSMAAQPGSVYKDDRTCVWQMHMNVKCDAHRTFHIRVDEGLR
jgi:hypothetical protein